LFHDESTLQLPLLYYASIDFVRDSPEIMKIVLEELNEAGAQVNREKLLTVERLREELKFSDCWLERLRGIVVEHAVVPLDHAAIKGLQLHADTRYDLQIISQRVRISDGTYPLVLKQNWTR
jgi:sulfonate transport system substrate-binding protein